MTGVGVSVGAGVFVGGTGVGVAVGGMGVAEGGRVGVGATVVGVAHALRVIIPITITEKMRGVFMVLNKTTWQYRFYSRKPFSLLFRFAAECLARKRVSLNLFLWVCD